MCAKVTELEGQLKKHKDTSSSVGFLTNKTSFKKVPSYAGKAEGYKEWRFKVGTFLYEEDGWIAILMKLDSMLTMPTTSDFEIFRQELNQTNMRGIATPEEITQKSHQLYLVLCSALEGAALTSVQNLEVNDDFVGYKAWLKIAHECTHMSQQRVQSLVVKIHAPKRVKKWAEVNPAIDEWETYLRQYETMEKTSLAPPAKIFALRQIVPEELDRDIYRNNSLTDYESVKTYVHTQVNIRRDLPRPSTTVPMDLDAAIKEATSSQSRAASWENEHEQDNYGERSCDHHDHHDHANKEQQDESKFGALYELVRGGGDAGVQAAQVLSMMKGGGKGYQGKGKGKRFDGDCSHCGKRCHMARDCWIKDKEMDEWRKSQGKAKGNEKGFGKNQWGKGNYNGYNRGGKGGGGYGKGVNFSGTDYQQSSTATSWAFSLQKGPLPDHEGFHKATRTASGKIISDLGPPPGLNHFENLKEEDREEPDELMEQLLQEYHKEFPNIGNYSKNSVRRAMTVDKQKKKRKKKVYSNASHLCMFEKQPIQKELNTFAAQPDTDGYLKFTSVMDSGASESVAPPTMCPQFDIKPSAGSIAGQNYLSASNGVMYNVGEQVLEVVTEAGKERSIKYQMVDKVTRPLNSISEICDAGGPRGQHVVFGRTGGVILNLDTGDQTPFGRTDGIYTMDMWVKPKPGFTRRD